MQCSAAQVVELVFQTLAFVSSGDCRAHRQLSHIIERAIEGKPFSILAGQLRGKMNACQCLRCQQATRAFQAAQAAVPPEELKEALKSADPIVRKLFADVF